MSDQTQTILNAVLALPEVDRLVIAERVLESLPPGDTETLNEEEFVAELDRRWAEFEHDPTVAAPWSDIRRKD